MKYSNQGRKSLELNEIKLSSVGTASFYDQHHILTGTMQ